MWDTIKGVGGWAIGTLSSLASSSWESVSCLSQCSPPILKGMWSTFGGFSRALPCIARWFD